MNPTPSRGALGREVECAITALLDAVAISRSVRRQMASRGAGAPLHRAKADASPVTVADYAVQAVVCRALSAAFGDDPIMAEETGAEFAGADPDLQRAVIEQTAIVSESAPGHTELAEWIDRGGSRSPSNRFWALDPIDGTHGFVAGRQYACALGLIVDGRVVLGALACPELGSGGVQQVGVTGEGANGGAFEASLAERTRLEAAELQWRSIAVTAGGDVERARVVQSHNPAHGAVPAVHAILDAARISTPPIGVDSQAKYGMVGRADAEAFVRVPRTRGVHEKVWDHAAGAAICEAAGGIVTDLDGKAFDWTTGTHLSVNRGLVVATPGVHGRLVDAVRAAGV